MSHSFRVVAVLVALYDFDSLKRTIRVSYLYYTGGRSLTTINGTESHKKSHKKT